MPKRLQKYIGPKIAHHSNLITTVLDQAAVLDFQLVTDLSDEQFLGHCISNGKS